MSLLRRAARPMFGLSVAVFVCVLMVCAMLIPCSIAYGHKTRRRSTHARCRMKHPNHLFDIRVRWIYRGHRHVHRHEIVMLNRLEVCSSTLKQKAERGLWSIESKLHDQRINMSRFIARYEPYYGYTVFGGSQHWAVPACIVEHESGGRNDPTHPIASSGYYQIAEVTWSDAYGVPYAYEATKAQQSVIASRVWNHGKGAYAWTTAPLCGY